MGGGVSHAGLVAFNRPYLQLFICEVLSQLFGYSFKVLEWDLACLVIIEQPESFQDLLFGVFLSLESCKRTGIVRSCNPGSDSHQASEKKNKNIEA